MFILLLILSPFILIFVRPAPDGGDRRSKTALPEKFQMGGADPAGGRSGVTDYF